jgi:hypothetical protein
MDNGVLFPNRRRLEPTTAHDNAFPWIADLKAAQARADRFAKQNWPRLLGQLARHFNPLPGEELRGQDYYWVMDQAEYATDVLFRDRPSLQPDAGLSLSRAWAYASPRSCVGSCRHHVQYRTAGQELSSMRRRHRSREECASFHKG